ncbi:hypothetical protein GCM10010232_01890 [Streptomyces amakusaensis]|uniref:Uncharacterized protein n=1 Tax=Streptomyces amakusaensis TaxID=67271 RepID=A0ABW0ANA4_9ACTN
MSTAPAPGPRDAKPSRQRPAAPRIDFDDPLDQQSSDDTDRGWGERPAASGGSADDLARFLDEKPPHHL